ncbi:Transcriptional regulatory protein SrrA [Anaerolineae bacterium]|nr:Transcriptional regulatory protein SrrA [Anaerolineae bacterium]
MFTLLLIEDDLKTARLIEKILTPHGFNIHHAPNGLKGLQLAREVHPHIILVDLNLPDLDGKVVANNLRGSIQKGTIPIVACTAETGVRAKTLALAMGCDSFISKPIDTRAFPGQILQLLKVDQGIQVDQGLNETCP